MHEKELRALGTIEQWLHDEQFSYTSRHLINGGMLLLNFEDLEGYEFKVEFTVEDDHCTVSSIFFAGIKKEQKEEVEKYLDQIRKENKGLEVEVDMNGNIIMKYTTLLSDDALNSTDQAEKLFWKSFGPARDNASTLRKILEKPQC